MNKSIAPVAGLALAAFLAVAPAHAVSCTQQAASCRSWAAGQGPQAAAYAAKCNAEISRCVARCKGGNKVFIGVYDGPGGGQSYPIDECK
ncbi:MAG: hypothetical protein U1E61_10535 [Bradyrhizobium sp.]